MNSVPGIGIMERRPTAGIILAAGRSVRFGRPKQTAELTGRPLLKWVLEAALQSELSHVFLVLGHAAEEIGQALGETAKHPKISQIFNPDYARGMSTSLICGMDRAKSNPSVMILLGDQPNVTTGLIDRLLEKFWNSEKDICIPAYRDRPGNPVLFSRRTYAELMAVEGDQGARNVVAADPGRVLTVPLDSDEAFRDIDTPADLETMSRQFKGR